jgi:enoyl-CoA hydratase/carnithine racemase
MTDNPAVIVETRDRKIYIGLNRPEAMNAQNDEMRDLLVDAVERMDADPDVLVGIVYGVGGRAFSAGADMKELRPGSPGRLRPEGQRPAWRHFEAFRWVSKPLIAAIDGYCLGGGLELANYCDIRIATERSTFGQPEPRTVGGPAGPGLQQLPKLIPTGEALLMQLTSQPITAQRAYQIGLVQRLCPDGATLMAEADAIADQMIECNPASLRLIKRVVRWGAHMPAEDAEKLAMIATETDVRARAGDKEPYAAHRPKET